MSTHVVRGAAVANVVGWRPDLSSVVKVTFDLYSDPETEEDEAAFAMTARDAEILGLALLQSAQSLRETPPKGQAYYKTLTPGMELGLLPWLNVTAEEIAVMDTTVRPHAEPLYVVEVNNGLGGHSGMGSFVAWCNEPAMAELVGAGLLLLRETKQ